MPALEDRLMRTVGTGDVATGRALLRSVSAVNIFYPYSFGFGLIGKKLLELKEVPFMQLFALFLPKPGGLPNGLQVFKHNYCPWLQRIYYLLADCMVNIGPKTVLLLRKFAKVSFGRLTARGLEFTSQFFVTEGNMFDMSAAKKLVVRSNGEVINTSIDTDNIAGKRNIRNFFLKNDVQKDTVSSQKQVSRRTSPIKVLLKIFGYNYRKLLSAVNGQKRNFVSVKPNVVASCIVSDRAKPALWARHFLLFLKPIFGGLKSFGSSHPGRNGKLGGKVGTCSLVSLMV